MKKTKFFIILTIMFIVVGIAAVTTNLIGNFNTVIGANTDDFFVYFSDALVDGTQDLSIVRNEKELEFAYELSAVGDKKIITYDVTNASKNYDAKVGITCTGSNSYLKVLNSFDEKNDLLARSTKTGTLTLELLTAVGEQKSYEVKCTINASAVERETQGSGSVNDALDPYPYIIGNEISIGDEKFNVISDNGDTITMLAQFNVGADYKQSTSENNVKFATTLGWAAGTDVNIGNYDGQTKNLVNGYVMYLQGETGDNTLTGKLITLGELEKLGCTYEEDDGTCQNLKHSSWLVNGQYWWIGTSYTTTRLWCMFGKGTLGDDHYGITYGVRPLITISKSALE